MQTLKADDRRRVMLPDAKPGQVYAYENASGTITLTPVKKEESKPKFPRGSLLKYFSAEKNAEELALQKGCSLRTPDNE